MRTLLISFLLFLALSVVSQAETKFLIFATKAEADAKELEIRNATQCASSTTKTSKYSEVIVKKDGTAILAVESTYNPVTKQTVDVANTVLTSSEKSSLVTTTNAAVKAELEKDTTATQDGK